MQVPSLWQDWSMKGNVGTEKSESVSHSVMSDSLPLWIVACQAPLSMGFPRQEYWNRLPLPSPGDLFWPRDQTQVSCIAVTFFTIWATREAPISYSQKVKRRKHFPTHSACSPLPWYQIQTKKSKQYESYRPMSFIDIGVKFIKKILANQIYLYIKRIKYWPGRNYPRILL